MGEVAKLTTMDDDDVLVPEPLEPDHVLQLGDRSFPCGDKLPVTTMIRHADNGLASMHHILAKLVDPELHEDMWDAFEAMDEDEALEAISELISTYSERPTKRPSRSQRGSGSKKRK